MLGPQFNPLCAVLVLCALLLASLNTTLTSVTRLSRKAGPVLDLFNEENVNQTPVLFLFHCPASQHSKDCPSRAVVLTVHTQYISTFLLSDSLLWQLGAGH